MTLKSKIFENPIVCEKTQYQYTIYNSSENPIPYIVPIFSNIILGQYKYWPNINIGPIYWKILYNIWYCLSSKTYMYNTGI